MVFGCSHCSYALLIRFFFEVNIPEDFHASLAWITLVAMSIHLWRGDLSPLGCEAAPKPCYSVSQAD